MKEFTFIFLNSDLFPQYFVNHTIFSQSPFYILALLDEEMQTKGLNFTVPKKYMEDDIAYWMGYLFAEWYQEYEFNPSQLTEKHFEWLFFQYDVLHTQSIKYAAEIFQEVFPNEENEKTLQ